VVEKKTSDDLPKEAADCQFLDEHFLSPAQGGRFNTGKTVWL